jgi:hypothetical protein
MENAPTIQFDGGPRDGEQQHVAVLPAQWSFPAYPRVLYRHQKGGSIPSLEALQRHVYRRFYRGSDGVYHYEYLGVQ